MMKKMRELVEKADGLWVANQRDSAIPLYVALLDRDLDDPYLWLRAALGLKHFRLQLAAAENLEASAVALGSQGNLLLALVAAKELSDLDPQAAERIWQRLGRWYGMGSERLLEGLTTKPPVDRRLELDESSLELAEAKAVRAMLKDVCAAAQTHHSVPPDADLQLPAHPLLSDLGVEDLSGFLPHLAVEYHDAGAEVITEGQAGQSFYMVARGVVSIRANGVELAHLRSRSFFGEMALLTDAPRSASVRCEAPTILLRAERATLELLAGKSPSVGKMLARYARGRLLRNLMACSPLFEPLDPKRRSQLIELFGSSVFEAGEVIIDEGGDSPGLRMVLSGSVRVSKGQGTERLELGQLGPGGILGEISLVKAGPASARVVADTKTVILTLPRDDFHKKVGDFPEVLAHIWQVGTEREQGNLMARGNPTKPIDVGDILI
jgi:cAMP-dependent protein kinase regulator